MDQKEDNSEKDSVLFTHIRHASSFIKLGKMTILIDPMLSEKHSLPSILFTQNKLRNPLTGLPFSIDDIVTQVDFVLLTHLHFDHFDYTAIQKIPKSTPIICSDFNKKKLMNSGFSTIYSLSDGITIDDLSITRFPATHGTGLFKVLLGKGSSYLLSFKGFKIFITGDCLLTKMIKIVLVETKPDLIIANGGAAVFKYGKPITMTIKDIQQLSAILPDSRIFVVHLDALNHCSETRLDYFDQLKNNLNIFIPADGEKIEINNVAQQPQPEMRP